jgi:flagellar protein FliS
MENSVLTATPLELVSMLYRCALDSVAQCRSCLRTGDIAGRSKPVTRAFDAVTELMLSLDHEQGGEVSRNLADLYAYVQQQILLGHCNQCDENFAEVERLLSTLLDSWVQISQVEAPVHVPVQEPGNVAASYSF